MQEIKTVVYSLHCVESCNVLPKMRPDRDGGIEAYIPNSGETGASEGQWVKAQATEQDGIITLSCDPTDDGFSVVYMATIERYNEAWQTGEYHQSVDPRVPRMCGPCADVGCKVDFKVRTNDQALFIDTCGQTYQFKHDLEYGVQDIMAQMVGVVVNHMDSHNVNVMVDSSFFDVLREALEARFTPHDQADQAVPVA
jgi:hypothetical protein